MSVSLVTLKQALIFFWALWMTVVVVNNIGDGLRALGVVPPSFPIHSGNYQAMRELMSRRRAPEWATRLLFAGTILWEIAVAYLLWRAVFDVFAYALSAFATSLALWAVFMITDEVFIAYDAETVHMRIFTAQLATLLLIILAPA